MLQVEEMYTDRLKLNTVPYNAVRSLTLLQMYVCGIGILPVILFTWNLCTSIHLKLLNCY